VSECNKPTDLLMTFCKVISVRASEQHSSLPIHQRTMRGAGASERRWIESERERASERCRGDRERANDDESASLHARLVYASIHSAVVDFRDFAIFSVALLLFALSPIDRTHTHYAEREWDSETVRQAEAPRTLGGAASSRQCGGPAVRGARREEVSLCCARSLALSPSFSHTLTHSLSAALYSSSERSRHRIVSLAVVVVPSRTQWLASF